jgi:hypothetical protein
MRARGRTSISIYFVFQTWKRFTTRSMMPSCRATDSVVRVVRALIVDHEDRRRRQCLIDGDCAQCRRGRRRGRHHCRCRNAECALRRHGRGRRRRARVLERMMGDGKSTARRRRRGRLLRRTQRGHVGARRRKLGRGAECVVVRVRRKRRPRNAAGTCGAGVLRVAADRLAKRRRQWRRGRRERGRRWRQRQIERGGTVVELGSERQAPLPVALRKETAKLGVGWKEESTKIKKSRQRSKDQ